MSLFSSVPVHTWSLHNGAVFTCNVLFSLQWERMNPGKTKRWFLKLPLNRTLSDGCMCSINQNNSCVKSDKKERILHLLGGAGSQLAMIYSFLEEGERKWEEKMLFQHGKDCYAKPTSRTLTLFLWKSEITQGYLTSVLILNIQKEGLVNVLREES